MGLEPVVLVMDWEERFGLTLTDAECANMRTETRLPISSMRASSPKAILGLGRATASATA